MSKLKNLEIFRWIGISDSGYMGFNTTIPFDAFAKLEKMKAMLFDEIVQVTNKEIPKDICNLKQIRYFDIVFARLVEYIPYDCIAQEWKELRYLRVATFPKISYILPEIWKLPKLETVILTDNGFSVTKKSFDFDTFNGF